MPEQKLYKNKCDSLQYCPVVNGEDRPIGDSVSEQDLADRGFVPVKAWRLGELVVFESENGQAVLDCSQN